MSRIVCVVFMLMARAWTCAALPLSELPHRPGLSRIGVFVGTFDPLHNGHEQTINAVLESCLVDAVVVLPQNFRILGQQPYKPKALPMSLRLDMAFFRYQTHERVFVPNHASEFGDRFVSGAMDWIRSQIPGVTLFGIHGSDNYSSLIQRFFDRISLNTEVTLLVEKYRMPDVGAPPASFLGRPVHVIYAPSEPKVSSTELRRLLTNPNVRVEDVEGLMNRELFELVRARGYYQSDSCKASLLSR